VPQNFDRHSLSQGNVVLTGDLWLAHGQAMAHTVEGESPHIAQRALPTIAGREGGEKLPEDVVL